MHTAHFAAALALKGREPRVPTWAVLVGAFVPDFVWVALCLLGIEDPGSTAFFDDWSHSLASTVVWASVFALPFWRRGRAVVAVIWASVLSHFALDVLIHPRNLALYPHAALHLGWNLWGMGLTRYWWLQLAITVPLLLLYTQGARRAAVQRARILGSWAAVLAIHASLLVLW